MCPPNLTHSFHIICKIIRFKVEKNKKIPCTLMIQQSFWGQNNHFLEQIWIQGLQILVPRYMSTKSHIHKTYETLKKTSFCTKGYGEIHIQKLFLTIKIAYKNSCIENPNGGNILQYLFYMYKFLFLWAALHYQWRRPPIKNSRRILKYDWQEPHSHPIIFHNSYRILYRWPSLPVVLSDPKKH